MPDKAAIRKEMRARRAALTEEAAREMSLAAQELVLAAKEWKNAASVALYMAVRKETDTRLLLESAWQSGKRVFLPYTPPSSHGIMHLLPCESGQALVPSVFGIPEPTPETCPLYEEGAEWVPELIIVPGTAFDRAGHRIGSGGGYYDRLFARHSMQDTLRVGLAYAFQVVEQIPADHWDTPMHAIATEESLVWL
ncbi:5-formyltetrahydrofolate cyclo-ligase [Desulfovibrio sp. OttesenSCG-928-O18]|nr:5-formyltetrahydrofolate cyclo-ligase [Desulfovibrio sp. OttesenSCG-928-O18]